MRISEIYVSNKPIISEQGYGRILRLNYPAYKVDPNPRVLVLGRWKHPTTGNVLVCGINVNYLSEEEIDALRQNLAAILAERTLKGRYDKGMELLPDIFSRNYRTYRQDQISAITKKETLRKWPSEKAREKEELRKKWKEMSPEARREIRQKRAREAAAKRAAEPVPPAVVEPPPTEYD